MINFTGRHFPKDVILCCVRWYIAYPLSYRNLEEIMEERGIAVDHSTVNRWVKHYSPQLEEAFHAKKKKVMGRWRMDETYLKLKGEWMYLYRAVDKEGRSVDFFLSKKRDKIAAKRFFKKAIKQNGKPSLINIDKSGANKAGIQCVNQENNTRIKIRQCKYLNNVVEQDHRRIKRIRKPMMGFKNFEFASATIAGVELMAMLKKGQQRYSNRSSLSAAEQFYALAS